MSLLRVDDLRKDFHSPGKPAVHAVNGVSFEIGASETLALIGESGSGKSTVARLVLGLLPADAGSVRFDGQDLTGLSRHELRSLRSRMTVVFQEPYESLDPRMTVRAIVEEPLRIHEPSLPGARRAARAREVLDQVSLGAGFANKYPDELSGGQQQRVGIARAIVTRPRLIVLDEPTSSLDLSVRAQILDLLAELQTEFGLAYLFISHDIHTVEYISHNLAVMYLGQVVERGASTEVFRDPRHPYTRALLSATLSPDPDVGSTPFILQGEIPSPSRLPHGCFLYDRCPIRMPECQAAPVPLGPYERDHDVACLRAGEEWHVGEDGRHRTPTTFEPDRN